MPQLAFVLNNIRSAWNVGAIMRTADALGASVVFIGYTPQPTGATLRLITKTAIGAQDTVPWEHFDTAQQVIDTLGTRVGVLHLAIEISSQSSSIFEYLAATDLSTYSIIYLWLGNEISGIERAVIERLDGELHLPMKGMKESLNVASTACTVGYLFAEHSSQTKNN